MTHARETLARLRAGEVIDYEGISLMMDDGDLQPGDLYIGARNSVRLGICLRVGGHPTDPSFDGERGPYVWSNPPWDVYPFNRSECCKVREV